MAKNLFIFNSRKMPVAFLICVIFYAFLVVAQFFVINTDGFWRFCYLYSEPVDDDGIRLEAQMRFIPQDKGVKKILLIGSSQINEDFDVEYLNNSFNKNNVKFYKLGIADGQPIDTFMLRDRLLGINPDLIVYVIYIDTFYSTYKFEKMKIYYFNPDIIYYFFKYLGAKKTIAYSGCFIQAFISNAIPLLKYGKSIPRVILKAAETHIASGQKIAKPKIYKFLDNRPKSYFEGVIKQNGQDKYKVTEFTQLEQKLFELFTAQVISRGIKLIVMEGPTHPLIKNCYKQTIDLMFNDFLIMQAKKIGFTYLSREQLPLFAEGDFIDFTHLNSAGRGKLMVSIEHYLLQVFKAF